MKIRKDGDEIDERKPRYMIYRKYKKNSEKAPRT